MAADLDVSFLGRLPLDPRIGMYSQLCSKCKQSIKVALNLRDKLSVCIVYHTLLWIIIFLRRKTVVPLLQGHSNQKQHLLSGYSKAKGHPFYRVTLTKGHPFYRATLTKGHPSYWATLTKGHPSYKAILTKGQPSYRTTLTKDHPLL